MSYLRRKVALLLLASLVGEVLSVGLGEKLRELLKKVRLILKKPLDLLVAVCVCVCVCEFRMYIYFYKSLHNASAF